MLRSRRDIYHTRDAMYLVVSDTQYSVAEQQFMHSICDAFSTCIFDFGFTSHHCGDIKIPQTCDLVRFKMLY